MAKREIPKRETTAFIQDEIQKERIRKENMYQVEFSEFRPSLESLREATPDKPGIDSFCSRQYFKTRSVEDDEEDEMIRKTLNITSKDDDPHLKYKEPMTTTMELGWDQYEMKPFKSMFDHRHKKTDITALPSKWDPNANVMTVKDRPK
ncbi:hypothetical protein TRFO_10061 [Tritrichomonas foetus]|uniref:Uncharacterized protein n=1 Tax=Tritrichomonas foetus TaxID=1144522 RepID=A0A1J4JAI0_9EUKA|nr:hypothetical protein TRFO_10061 [Tritrichomonas foetus]|eukprot:OHS96160.1 hypothetical protein TRFO_10061 [Tritrichomonas foetus]